MAILFGYVGNRLSEENVDWWPAIDGLSA